MTHRKLFHVLSFRLAQSYVGPSRSIYGVHTPRFDPVGRVAVCARVPSPPRPPQAQAGHLRQGWHARVLPHHVDAVVPHARAEVRTVVWVANCLSLRNRLGMAVFIIRI